MSIHHIEQEIKNQPKPIFLPLQNIPDRRLFHFLFLMMKNVLQHLYSIPKPEILEVSFFQRAGCIERIH